MLKITLKDSEFQHIQNPTCYHGYDPPKYIQWDREGTDNRIAVFTERHYKEVLQPVYKDKIKIAWPLESTVIHPYANDDLKNGLHKYFDYVLTFDCMFTKWLRVNSKAVPIWWTPAGGWIWKKDFKMYPKSKNIQMIASKKDWSKGHKLRHEVAAVLGSKIDKYGKAYKPFFNTIYVFRDYRFAIVIENINTPYYFTDKLTSAFYTGTIPIYWNPGWIAQYFNPKGMILWNTIAELITIVDRIDIKLYNNILGTGAVRDNFYTAQKYAIPEDYMYENFFCQFDN